MPTLTLRNGVTIATDALAERVTFDETRLHCELQDGRIISVPIRWYPRLRSATVQQLNDWVLFAGGIGIHWESLDEDLLVSVLMAGCAEPDNEGLDPFDTAAVFLELHDVMVESVATLEQTNYSLRIDRQFQLEPVNP